MPILEVKNLVKTYGKGENKIYAVNNVSFSVEKGEFVAIVGSSGSGKSTLLHIIGGVDNKDDGTIIVNRKDISNFSEDDLAIYRRREVGIVYQFYNLLPTLTIQENIEIPYRLDGKKLNEEKLINMLNILGLSHRRDNLPNQLSGGEQQRTSIGRALINTPSILLADEPTGNLDSKNSQEIIKLLKDYNENYNQTIILVTHDPNVANVADRVIQMSDGKIISDSRRY
ncbi:ABC transporter ATP-binding protein [Helcococcus kunzii]|uniref:ABC transporter ATP-binding protein n=1 Tax=Helcococcus kunzii TaxID=40091 RepID=UPI001BB0B77D|nr:ABC transporter ATP-binding protein [Helcococcus kunzii]MCT1796452.1 ABC transporter ATP-binding protein [Helcococcus kunzii]MCT1989289.1 ABC transporter ATP-binding protein [Helcococcus kunzii]QUY65418.1 ABC transporter ATP-binding protein [Helcococcus kunzii]QZO76092.1 ABC transporter ATP-binding protein [Helcococcus kunzii]